MSLTCELQAPREGRLKTRPRRKVLHVINGDHYAGAERVQDLLAQRLPEVGFDVGIACVKPRLFPKLRKSTRTPLVETPMRGKIDLRPAWQLARLVRREGYELLHTHSPRAALVGRLAAAWSGVPLVHHVHGQTAVEIGAGWNFRISAWVERAALRGAEAVIAVSPSAAAYLAAEGFDPRRVAVVPNGVPAQAPLETRCRPGERWTVGMVAMFRPRKGAEDLLRAIAQLRRDGRDIVLRAIGGFENPEYQATLRRLTDSLGIAEAVTWVGFSSDVPGELARVDLLALPSVLCEGMPMVVLEAMASGVPVVGTRVDGITDVIRDCQSGLLARPNDPQDLADTIERVVAGKVDWQVLRRIAHREHAERYSDTKMAEGVADIYHHVLSRQGAGR